MSLAQALLVGAGGFLGAVARYLAGLLALRVLPAGFPYGTLAVNVTGSFAIGVLGVLADDRRLLGPDARLFLLAGVLGGYTTFSSLAYETLRLAQRGQGGPAAANVAAHVVLGLLAVWLGAALGRQLASGA